MEKIVIKNNIDSNNDDKWTSFNFNSVNSCEQLKCDSCGNLKCSCTCDLCKLVGKIGKLSLINKDGYLSLYDTVSSCNTDDIQTKKKFVLDVLNGLIAVSLNGDLNLTELNNVISLLEATSESEFKKLIQSGNERQSILEKKNHIVTELTNWIYENQSDKNKNGISSKYNNQILPISRFKTILNAVFRMDRYYNLVNAKTAFDAAQYLTRYHEWKYIDMLLLNKLEEARIAINNITGGC